MKKCVVLDILLLLFSGALYLASCVSNVTTFVYPFTTKSHINLIFIFRVISYISFTLFLVLLVLMITYRIKRKEVINSFSKRICLITLCLVMLGSIVSIVIINANYKAFGDNIISKLSSDSKITSMIDTDVDASGVRLFGTQTLSVKIHDWENKGCEWEYLTSDYPFILKQYHTQFFAVQPISFDEIEYKGLRIQKYHKQRASENLEISGNEKACYLVEGKNDLLYMECFTIASEENALDEKEELENLYLIYNQLTAIHND